MTFRSVAGVGTALLLAVASVPATVGAGSAAAPAATAVVVLGADDTVQVRRAPAPRQWQRQVTRPGWRRLPLPLPSLRKTDGALLVRRSIRIPAASEVTWLRLRTAAATRVWLDGRPMGRLAPGGGRLELRADAGRHVLALRLRHSRSPVRMRVVALRAPQSPMTDPRPSPGDPSPSPTPAPEEVDAITRVCRINDPRLPELSGMAPGLADPSVLWVHNDSGDAPRIFALDRRTCAIRAEITLRGVTAGDIEGIAMGRALDGSGELWVGDVGDSSAKRASVRLYRFAEPRLADQSVAVRIVTVRWTGGARNCESIAVDPTPDGHVYLVSKEESASGIHRLQGDYRSTGMATTGPPLATTGKYATDAAIAPDRSLSVIRFYTAAEMRTGVLPGTAPARESMPTQRQGEAIAFAPDSGSVYLASEGSDDLIRIPLSAWGR